MFFSIRMIGKCMSTSDLKHPVYKSGKLTYSTEEKLERLSSPGAFFLVKFSTKVGMGKSSMLLISLNSAGDFDLVNSCLYIEMVK